MQEQSGRRREVETVIVAANNFLGLMGEGGRDWRNMSLRI
jgi:hypothetical protein